MNFTKIGIFILIFIKTNCLNAQESFCKQYLRQWLVKKPATTFDSLMQRGMQYVDTDTSQAALFFSQAINIAYKNLEYVNGTIAHIAIGEMNLEKQTYRKAHGYFFRAKNVISNIPYESLELGLATYGIARVQYLSGNYRTSVLNFLATIYNAQQRKDRNLEAEASEYLGLIYSHFQDFGESIAYFRKCYELQKQLDNDKGCLRIAEKLGEIYYFNRRYDSA
jgi:tetratricopeptide (TPR) repeat protein